MPSELHVPSGGGASPGDIQALIDASAQPLDSDLTALAALSTTSFGRALLASVDAAALRTAAAVVIGTDVEAFDADLAAIAALSTTSYGRAFLALADAAAGRTALALGTASTHAHGDYETAGAAAAAQAASQPLDSDLTAIAALTTTSFGRGLLATADIAALRAVIIPARVSFTRTAGDLTLNSTTYASVPTIGDIVVAASGVVAGQWLDVSLNALVSNVGVATYFDIATIVSGSIVNRVSGGDGGATREGLPNWQAENRAAYQAVGGSIAYQLQSGDLNSGGLTIRVIYRTATATNRTLYANADDALFVQAKVS